MNIKSFFVSALSSALDIGFATCDDVVRHVTPDVLATHLPRSLWARLLTACVGAPVVDAQLIVDTIGVPNLCEHVPTPIIWACIAEIAERSLVGADVATMPPPRQIVTRSGSQPSASVSTKPVPLSTPPPPDVKAPVAARTPSSSVGPTIRIPEPTSAPLANLIEELEAEDKVAKPARSRTSAQQRLRQTNSNIGRLATTNRRPQAQAAAPTPGASPEFLTEAEFEIETDVGPGKDDWRTAIAVDDEQLVDWSTSEEPVATTNDAQDSRKR